MLSAAYSKVFRSYLTIKSLPKTKATYGTFNTGCLVFDASVYPVNNLVDYIWMGKPYVKVALNDNFHITNPILVAGTVLRWYTKETKATLFGDLEVDVKKDLCTFSYKDYGINWWVIS